jgi:hypothetical protein
MIGFHALPDGSIHAPIPTIQMNASPYAIMQILCDLDGYIALGEPIRSIYFSDRVILYSWLLSVAGRSIGK